ncbi:MAG: endonuclease III domain-containing protein [bacterium]
MNSRTSRLLNEIYEKMYAHFGPQHWWPGETPFEVMVGAILTQNTSWTNVEKAISNLKAQRLLNVLSLEALDVSRLSELIRPAGYFNVKAKRLKNFIHFLMTEYGGVLEKMKEESLPVLREKLLSVKGIGPETADSILLYAVQKNSFVIDQYTYRLLSRHFLVGEDATYEEMQQLMAGHLPEETALYNEYHALIVMIGKNFCKKTPVCEKCPLNGVNW